MSVRAFLVVSAILSLLPLGCTETPPPAPPSGAPTIQPKKTDAGVQIKKHNVPLGPDPSAIAPGP